MKRIKRRCAHCTQTGGIYNIYDDTLSLYCGKTQPRTIPIAPRPECRPLFVREAKRLRARRLKMAMPPMF